MSVVYKLTTESTNIEISKSAQTTYQETSPEKLELQSTLMIGDNQERPKTSTIKRKSDRSPASLKKPLGNKKSSGSKGVAAARKKAKLSKPSYDPDTDNDIVVEDATINKRPKGTSPKNNDSDLGYGGDIGVGSLNSKDKSDSITTVDNPPASTTSGGSSEAPPVIKGTVPPLMGLIVNNSNFNFFGTAHAAITCGSPSVEIFDLETMTVLANNPIANEGLSSSTEFKFSPNALGIKLETPTRYMLRTQGCTENFERIITSFFGPQDLGPATTLLSKTIYSAISIPYADIDPIKFKEVTEVLETVTNSSDTLTDTYNKLIASAPASSGFNTVFGTAPPVLAEAAPKITDYTIPTSLTEKAVESFSVSAIHWNTPTYVIAYEWYVDGTLISNASNPTYVPPANSKNIIQLEVYVGRKNAGDSNVNRAKPHHNFTVNIPVQNTFPATAPSYALNAGSNNPTPTNSISLDLNTGTLSGGVYSNCETFSNFAITENATTPVAGDFTYTCSTGTTQTVPYTILSNDESTPTTIKIWAKDERGLVSTSQDLSILIDKTSPVIAFTGMQANYRANRSTTFNWQLTEKNPSTNAADFTAEFFNGSTWSTLSDVAVTAGNNSSTPYSISFTLPNINTNSAQFRVTYVDLAGNSTTQSSSVFGIQAPILGISPNPHNYGSVLNKAQSSDVTFTVSNTGLVFADNCVASSLTGANASEFTISTDNCGTNNLVASGNCTVLAKAAPTSKGAKSASLNWSCDSGADSVSTSLSYVSANNPPTSAGTQAFTTNEDTVLNFSVSPGSDIDGVDTLTYSIVSPPSNGTLTNCMAADGDLNCDYSPNLNFNGSDSFIYRVYDGTNYSVANTTVNLTINPINDAPTIPATQSVGVVEDTLANFSLNAGTDVDGDTLTYIVVSTPSNGTLSCTGGTSTSCTYNPNANFNGTDSFTYKTNDGSVDSNTATVTLNISATNDAPVMSGGQAELTNEDTLVSFTLAGATDIDLPAQTLSYKIITPPSNGTITNCINNSTFTTDLTCDYTPNANYNGADSFTYKAYDGVVESSTSSTVLITINTVNDAPTVTSVQAQSTNEDTILNFNIGAGTDIESDPLTYSVVSTSSNGTLSCTEGASTACTYTPNLNYNGSDSFTYKTNDGSLDSNTATVNITVNAVNDAPTVTSVQAQATNEDTLLNFNLGTASDVDGDAQTYSVVSTTSNGTLSCTGGASTACTYTPNLNYNGSDSFTYKSNDGSLDSNTATVNITVNAVNDAPIVTSVQAQSTNEDTVLNFNFGAATDVDGDAQTYSIGTTTTNGTLSCTGGASTACTYTPNANFNGSDFFTYRSDDGNANSNPATVNITINAVNDAPTVTSVQAQSTNEDTLLNFNLGTATDVDGDAQTYSVVSTTSNGTLSCTGGASTACTYTPNLNYNGSDSFTYKSNDGSLDSNTATVNITVNAVNDAPTVTSVQAQATNEDTLLNFNLGTASDVDGDAQTYSVVSTTSNGTLSCTGGASTACTYAPNLNYNGSDSFTYKSNDGTADSNTATVNITVNAVNDAPTVASPQAQSTDEDNAKIFLLGAGSDIESDPLTYIVVSTPSNGGLSCTGGASQTCTYTPNLNYNGADSFTYKVNDGSLDSNIATVNFTINAINDAPTLTATQSKSTNEDTLLNFNLGTATDVDGDAQTYSVVSTTSNGSLSCTGGASTACTYTPNANYNGADSFTYRSNDGTVNSNTATVNITINAVNDRPVMVGNQSFNVNDNTAHNFTLSGATDIDLPAQTISYKVISGPSNGSLTNCINGAGYSTDVTCTYTANTNYNGSDSFTYIANDSVIDAISTKTVSFTVTDITPPSAPSVARSSAQYTSSTAATFTASSCTDTPFIFFNEGTKPAAGAAGWQACTTTASALTYTFSTGNGTKTIKAWAKDPNGNVSLVSTNMAIYYDTVAPTLAITTPSIQKGGATYNVQWTMTEVNTSTAQSFSIDFYNGSTWSNGVASKTSLNGPLTTQAFNVNYTLPSLNVTTARFRVNFTDLAGNSATATSNTFEIDSIAPSIAITSPAASSYHQSSLTMTGNCETGSDVNFSGAIQASFSLTCAGGSFSQLLNLSDNDGNKTITLTHTDPAGNQSTTSRTFIRDEVAPILTKTTGDNPGFTGSNNFSWGGTCEGNYTINVTGDQTTSFACSSGSWSWTTGDKLTDGTFSYNLAQTDGAGNTSTALTLSWERDGTPPPFTIASPVAVASSGTGAFTSNQDTVSLSGNCEGTNSIAITGTVTDAVSCSSGSWTWTTPSVSTDATRGYTFTQSDSAGNTSVVTLNWTRDTTGPALTISSILEKTNTATVTYSGGCENGLTINVTGAQTSTATCTAGAWSWTSAVQSTDATRVYTFGQTNAVPNTTTVNATWIRETNIPTISAFSTSAGNPTKNANVPVSMTATSQNAQVHLSHICIKTNDTVQPSASDDCWVAINGPAVGLPLGQTLSLSEEYFHLLGWTPNTTLSATAWVKDQAENISDLTNAGAGTSGTDKFDRVYDPGEPPVVSDVIAANIVNAPNPPTRAQAEVPAGSDVYVRWIATDNVALPAGGISLYYSTDEINFTQIGGAEALNHGTNYGCTGITLAANEGCFKWTGGSPLNVSYKIRVKATDSTSISSQMISNPLNSGLIKIIAGNTEAGLGGSAVTAMFFTRKSGSESDPGTLVVTNDGKIYFNDYKRGILTVDPNDGKQKIFIPNTGTSSGDGGPAVNATLNYAVKMALDFQNRLLIMDRNRIRRVNLNEATPSIETIIGGGAQTGDTVVNPLDLSIYSHSTNSWTARGMVFFSTPNGDIWFHSDYALKNSSTATYRIRKFNSATGQIESKYFTGTGDGWEAAKDILKCRVMNPGLRFDPGTSEITGVTIINNSHTSYTGCDTADSRYSRSYFDPSTFQTLATQLDDSYRYYRYFHITGMDGNTYVVVDRNYVNRVNFDGTYTRVLGQGTRGHCEDGTANLSCMMDIQDFFVTSTGKLYFTDRGQIRTIDGSGNVVTLFGQNPGYGDGVNALNSRFDKVNTVARLNNGKVIVADYTSYYMKEFTIEGNIDIIAGNGNYQQHNTTDLATAQGLYDGSWWLADKATGEIFIRRNSEANITKLNRTTNKWELIIGGGTNEYWDNDGQPGASRKSGGNQRYGIPIGYDTATKKLLLNNMKYNSVETHWEDFMIKEYDGTDSWRQTHIAGTNDPAQTYAGGYDGICALPAPAASCKVPYWSRWGLNTYWDAAEGRWILAGMEGGPDRDVYAIVPGGNMTKISTTARNIDSSTLWLKEGGTTDVMYYCNGGRIYKHNLDTDTDLGALTWQISNMYCRGYKMDYNPTNNSIIFPFEQNGLYGVGEYFLP